MGWSTIETDSAADAITALTNASMTWKGQSIVGVFEADFTAAGEIGGWAPSFLCSSSAVRGIKKGDEVKISTDRVADDATQTTRFRVGAVRPDGTGLVMLMLHEKDSFA